jgi:hypothetical protein
VGLFATLSGKQHSPRSQWHTFYDDGEEPARLPEIISPAGCERFFGELGGVTAVEPQTFAELCARHELEMDPDSVPELPGALQSALPREPI